MQIHQQVDVEARVGDRQTSELAQGLSGQPLVRTLAVAPQMSLTLTGSDGLWIRPIGPEGPQSIPSGGFGRWRWSVTAMQAGNQELDLTGEVDLGGGVAPLVVPSLTWALPVRVSPLVAVRDFGQANWQWIASVVALPTIGFLWRARSKRRKVQSRSTVNAHASSMTTATLKPRRSGRPTPPTLRGSRRRWVRS
jgi:hypothetical protein